MRSRLVRYLVIAAPLALVAGCSIIPAVPGQERTDTSTVDAGSATSASIDIDFAAGELTLGGGVSGLAAMRFSYDTDARKPNVSYVVTNSRGALVIAEPKHSTVTIGVSHNEWNVKLGNSIPVDLTVNTGAGTSKIALGGLNLASTHLASGAGDLQLDLSGVWTSSVPIDINGGVGKVSVRLPTDVGVRVTADTGVGSVEANGLRKDGGAWVNDAYGTSPVTLNVTVKVGVGEVSLDAE